MLNATIWNTGGLLEIGKFKKIWNRRLVFHKVSNTLVQLLKPQGFTLSRSSDRLLEIQFWIHFYTCNNRNKEGEMSNVNMYLYLFKTLNVKRDTWRRSRDS